MSITARLAEDPLHRDPLAWVRGLLDEAARAEGDHPERDPMRVALATADERGRPSVRYVLLKELGADGFVFYTNYQSRKATELEANPFAALAFHWWTTGVQIRAEGSVTRVSAAESDAYCASRARASQLGAWASDQSRPIASRRDLEAKLAEVDGRFEGQAVERPPHWGGYRLQPEALEIWINGEHRLHERYRYEREGGGWTARRLSP